MTVHHRFESLVDFMCSVANAADHPAAMDDRLRPLAVPGQGYMAAAGSTASVPSEGGFAVPTEFADRLWSQTYDTGQVLALCDQLEMSTEKLRVPAIADSTRADDGRFGGMKLAWASPGDQLVASNPEVRAVEFRARKLGGISYGSDELVADAPAWEATLLRLFGLESSHVVEQEVINGAGSSGPLGVLNSPALVTVNPESGQAAATIRAENLVGLWTRLWGASRRRAVWLLGDDAAAQIALASLGAGSALAQIVTFTDGGMQILGRPAYSLEQCSQLGAVGDVILADLSQYAIATRSVRFQSSIHVRFIHGENVFRFTMRCDGQPYWASSITPKNAAATQSPFVTLAAR